LFSLHLRSGREERSLSPSGNKGVGDSGPVRSFVSISPLRCLLEEEKRIDSRRRHPKRRPRPPPPSPLSITLRPRRRPSPSTGSVSSGSALLPVDLGDFFPAELERGGGIDDGEDFGAGEVACVCGSRWLRLVRGRGEKRRRRKGRKGATHLRARCRGHNGWFGSRQRRPSSRTSGRRGTVAAGGKEERSERGVRGGRGRGGRGRGGRVSTGKRRIRERGE
jgi:hypothetical protein